ncbi:MAG: glutathione S-transferase N-terminal domain-containing protein [Myxococcota bacterium]
MSPRLSLYMFEGCAFCQRVRIALDDLGLSIEERDIRAVPEHATALVEALGQSTVPVLRIDHEETTEWLPESSDIVRYLYEEHGDGRRPPALATGFPQTIGAALALVLFLLALIVEGPVRLILLTAAALVFALRTNLQLLWRLRGS